MEYEIFLWLANKLVEFDEKWLKNDKEMYM